jgi:CMP-N-acetylneuraminic acid synthetase
MREKRPAEAPSAVALIPARSGSSRVRHKNIRTLQGHPALAYTIAAALGSGVFRDVIVSTDSTLYAEIARHYGAEIPFLRPQELSEGHSTDFAWLDYTLRRLKADGRAWDCFSILRPTSPFRMPETILRAWTAFLKGRGFDSLRAVEKCRQHPGKMWVIQGEGMVPLLPLNPAGTPWHSTPYQALPPVYVQNASLEIAWTRVLLEKGTIAGERVLPFLTEGCEGLDINDEKDWWYAEHLLARREAALPPVASPPFPGPADHEMPKRRNGRNHARNSGMIPRQATP